MDFDAMNDDCTIVDNGSVALSDRYHIVRQLGRGGMGSVWLAEDALLENRKVAIKMLPSILVANKQAYNQLKSEALVSLKLTHPNIATVRAFEENGDNPFIVMDYIEGSTLDNLIAGKRKLSTEEVVRLLQPIAAALDYAHKEGIIHRDVKPSNVMIRKDGRPFILDFGIAREMQETMSRVTGKVPSGTLSYMSPEQLKGDKPSVAQDIYSFAAMAYECIAGSPPFSRGEIEYQILNREPEDLQPSNKFTLQVMRGLSKVAQDRPNSCLDFFGANSVGGANFGVGEARAAVPSIDGCVATAALQPQDATQRICDLFKQELEKNRIYGGRFVIQGIDADDLKNADDKNSIVQFALGCACELGASGMTKDINRACEYYKASFEAGCEVAMNNVGYLVANGYVQDYNQSFKWLADKANGESGLAAFNLGLCYDVGIVETAQRDNIKNLYMQAAKMGAREGWQALASRFSYEDAIDFEAYFHAAADEGFVIDMAVLGDFYLEKGKCDDEKQENLKKAVFWYERGAALASSKCYFGLACCYADGLGVPQDFAKAKDLLILAIQTLSDWRAAIEQQRFKYKEDPETKPRVELYEIDDTILELFHAIKGSDDRPLDVVIHDIVFHHGVYKGANELGKNVTCVYRQKRQQLFDETGEIKEELLLDQLSPCKCDGEDISDLCYDEKIAAHILRITAIVRGWQYSDVMREYSSRIKDVKRDIPLSDSCTMRMMYCPPGEFLMGSPRTESGRQENEKLHRVKLSHGFWIGEYPVRDRDWYAVMGRRRRVLCFGHRTAFWDVEGRNPVENVTWDDCQRFCRKLGNGMSLPTEAQWEYACRAGIVGANRLSVSEVAWFKDNSKGKTQGCGWLKANNWGIHDMLGNVCEWCADWYGEYDVNNQTDPKGPADGTQRICRGGHWGSETTDCRAAARFAAPENYRSSVIGFRVCVPA